ncbi:bifunctional metallophosphatase/5'-nucleotidase [Alteromonas sediminis]|uniref:Bifunctional metallophosphatase/5'-nucleotidase n=1 Tax=Alteromonas sediminis TaxID=2259342 RepID=A0A3N5YAQ9_9ALTE|nr:5'-nucleotidase C-terminal domain-containing protein [Alteromonas sediminis]RPJ68699.1 bifunctional metallophosphatase/5'-nucleotidase [Alteromonas sediminis]
MTKLLLKARFTLPIFLSLLFSFAVQASDFKLILAADMPDISDPASGRYAELKTLINQHKEQNDTVFFVFGGGSFGPSAMSVFDRGAHIIDILNSLEPDVMTVTKREFSYFEDELSLRAYEAAFPIVTTNVIDKRFGIPPDGLVKSALIEKGKVKLGIISILNQRIIDEYLLPKITVLDPQVMTMEHTNKLRQQGADVILIHYSYPFSFIVDLLEQGIVDVAFMSDTRLLEKNQNIAKHPNNLLLERPGSAIVADMKLATDDIALLNKAQVDLMSFAANTSIQLQVDSYQLRLNRLLDERIGFWGNDTSTLRPDVRGKENRFANFIVDTMKAYAQSDIALINGGSIRGDTFYKAGTPVTRRDIATELPFRSTLTRIKVTGEQIKDALETGLSQVEYLKGSFPHVAGMTYSFDSTKQAGQRVTAVTLGKAPLEPEKTYTLATTDYLANGGDGYTSLAEGINDDPEKTLSILVSDLVIQGIRINGSVDTDMGSRIQDKAGMP